MDGLRINGDATDQFSDVSRIVRRRGSAKGQFSDLSRVARSNKGRNVTSRFSNLNQVARSMEACPAWAAEWAVLVGEIGPDLSLPRVIVAILDRERSWRVFSLFCEKVMRKKEAEREREQVGDGPRLPRSPRRRILPTRGRGGRRGSGTTKAPRSPATSAAGKATVARAGGRETRGCGWGATNSSHMSAPCPSYHTERWRAERDAPSPIIGREDFVPPLPEAGPRRGTPPPPAPPPTDAQHKRLPRGIRTRGRRRGIE